MSATTRKLLKSVIAISGCFMLSAAWASETLSTESILKEFVESYRNDSMALSTTFGIKVEDEWWHVRSERVQEAYPAGKENQYTLHNLGPHIVSLHQGKPAEPTWYFHLTDRATLDNIHTKKWTASTAAAKSTPADVVAFNVEVMDGFERTKTSTAIAYQVMEHFWKADQAELTQFSRDSSLPSHGAAIVSLYTMKDKRISWFSLGQEEAANAERGLDKGQAPNLFIFTKGKGKAQIGDENLDIEAGMSIFVGPYVKHVFYNPNEEPLEGILVLFGDNIDYIQGESYLDSLEREYAFYGNSPESAASR